MPLANDHNFRDVANLLNAPDDRRWQRLSQSLLKLVKDMDRELADVRGEIQQLRDQIGG